MRAATSGAGTPELSHCETPAWRRSYGRKASTEETSPGTSANSRVCFHTREYDDAATTLPPFTGEERAVLRRAELLQVLPDQPYQRRRNRHDAHLIFRPLLQAPSVVRLA